MHIHNHLFTVHVPYMHILTSKREVPRGVRNSKVRRQDKTTLQSFWVFWQQLIKNESIMLKRDRGDFWDHKYSLTDTAMLISELTRFDSFYIFFSTELLVFLECWPTGKEFRLPWHSFVRVEIHFKYWLSINKKYRLTESWIFHGGVVRASDWRTRGRVFESRTTHYQSLYFLFPFLFICPFISLSFLFASILK